jgi:G3E family GTPase
VIDPELTLPARPPRTGPVPITVLCGFLGSGKTTLLKRLLRESGLRRYAVIVNDLSELAVDAELIEEAREGLGETLIALNRGSLGGALLPELRQALDAIESDETVDYLLIETSGGTQPDALIDELLSRAGARLDTVVTVVDGLNLTRDYDGGRALLSRGVADSETATGVLYAQIARASVLLVSKADLLTRVQAETILRSLRRINPHASITTIAFGAVPAERVTDTRTVRPRRGAPRQSTALADDPALADIGSDVLSDPRPFHPQRLYDLFTQRLPLGVHRTKGWIWLASRPMDVFVWNQAGSYFGLEWVATWKAGVLTDPTARLYAEEKLALAERLAAMHPVFGDRLCELTVIGTARDRSIFLEELRACLCTEEELVAWQRGDRFADPWPTRLRKI